MKIAIYCHNLNQLHFFLRFLHIFKQKKHEFVFWSNRLSVISKAWSRGCEVVLLSGYKYGNDNCLTSTVEEWYKTDSGLVSPQVSEKLVKRYVAAADRFFEKYQPDMLWIWNGSNLTCKTLVDVGKNHGISRTLFFEIGNFPGKLFVDTQGVNCRSWYAAHRDQLRETVVDMPAFREWKADYLKRKTNAHVVPQAKNITRFNFNYLFDLFGFWFLGAITVEKLTPVWKTVDFFKRRFFKIPYDDFSPEQNPGFVFFPLQVSTDSQVLWNCDVSQSEALRKVASNAKYEGKILVVKPHPAEPHFLPLKEIAFLKKELNFKLVNGNTFNYLKHCSCVVTLNSTVGLEALLLNKPVEIVGRAHYAGADELDLAVYTQKYLLDIDFFSNVPISVGQFEIILERLGCCSEEVLMSYPLASQQ